MRIRYYYIALMVLLVITSLSASAQFVKATKYQYTSPKTVQYTATMSCNLVEPDQSSRACYRDGVSKCKVQNHGKCFNDCEAHVRSVCMGPMTPPSGLTRVPSCIAAPGFEKDFKKRADCARAAFDFCDKNCHKLVEKKDCTQRAQTRCSFIGRIFI